jgi:hypothetical protein
MDFGRNGFEVQNLGGFHVLKRSYSKKLFHIANISLCLLLTWQDMAKGFMFGSSINI